MAGAAACALVAVVGFLGLGRKSASEPAPEAVIAELVGHADPVLACAFSSDSSMLATGAADATIRVWDIPSFQLRKALVRHTTDVQGVGFSADGMWLASVSWDGTARVWDTTTWQPVAVLNRPVRQKPSIAFSPDGSRFAVVGGKGRGSIEVYDTATQRLAWSGPAMECKAQEVAYSSDGQTIVVADDGGNVTLLGAARGNVRDSFHVAEPFGLFPITQVSFGVDDSELLVLQNAEISKWDLATHRLTRTDRRNQGRFTGFAFFPDKRMLVRMWRRSDDFYGELQVVDAADWSILATARCRNSYLACICVSPNAKYIATGGEWDTCVVRIWDVEKLMRGSRR
jgi:WD40 repeat protein